MSFQNPQESAGTQHNNILDFIGEHTPDIVCATVADSIALIHRFTTSQGDPVQLDERAMTSQLELIGDDPFSHYAKTIVSMQTIGSLSKTGAAFLTAALDQRIAAHERGDSDTTKFDGKMRSEEETIHHNSALTQTEKDLLLGSAAVARHSARFWFAAAQNSGHSYHPMLQSMVSMGGGNPDDPIELLFKGIRRFAVDVAGFFEYGSSENASLKSDRWANQRD